MFPFIVTLASGLVAQPTPRNLTDASLLWKRCGMGHTARLLAWSRHPRSATQESVQPLGPKLHPSVASDAKLGRPARGRVAGRPHVHNSDQQLYWALAAGFPPPPAVLAAWASRSGHRRPAGRTRGQGSEARAHAGRGRRGPCRGLGFTGPQGRAGGELRPPVALGAESHPRPRPKPRVIFNQRRHPNYHPGSRGQRARGARR